MHSVADTVAPTENFSNAISSTANADDGGCVTFDRKTDNEVMLLTQIRLALSSMLHMLETAKENLIFLGLRLDRLREASEKCRIAVQKQQSLKKNETA